MKQRNLSVAWSGTQKTEDLPFGDGVVTLTDAVGGMSFTACGEEVDVPPGGSCMLILEAAIAKWRAAFPEFQEVEFDDL